MTTEDPWQHYQNVGWKVGFSPSANFNIDQYWNANPDVFTSEIEPLRHWLKTGKKENRQFKSSPWENPDIRELLSENFNSTFYLNFNELKFVPASDALGHFCRVGWRLNYDPNPNFDTLFYKTFERLELELKYPYFLHFLLNRKNLERSLTYPRRKYAWDLANVGGITPRITPKAVYRKSQSPTYTTTTLNEILGILIANNYIFSNQSIISWGNNNYLKLNGGIEVILWHELQDCISASINHIYIYREVVTNADNEQELNYYSAIINGLPEIHLDLELLDILLKRLSEKSIIKAFHLHGKIFSEVQDINQVSTYAVERKYIVHDYSFICSSYTLLRNEIEYCSAPEPSSNLCQTCIAGSGRAQHVANHQRLLEENQFSVVSPSPVAAEIFSQTFPTIKIKIRPHLNFNESSEVRSSSTVKDKKYRIAFTGHSVHHKGWNQFAEFVRHVASRNDFECFHLGKGLQMNNVKFIQIDSTNGKSNMRTALEENEIDIVFQWSLWPETFGLVTAEAIAAGCLVITNSLSGNTGQMATAHDRSLIFDSFEQLLQYHDSGDLEAEVTRRKRSQKTNKLDIQWNSFIDLDDSK